MTDKNIKKDLEKLLDNLKARSMRAQQDLYLSMTYPDQFHEERNADYYNGFDNGLDYAIEKIEKLLHNTFRKNVSKINIESCAQ